MLVSAILTSVGINSALCVIFLVLYSILKKQPSYYEVYVPRLLAEGSSKRRSRFNLERLIPSTGWLSKAWRLSEEELLSSSGLDAVVYMRTITLCLKVFSFTGIIGMLILLPVNCTGTELHRIDFADLYTSSLDAFTISNVNSGSKLLWIHFSSVYVVTIFICYLLYYEYNYISSKRIAYFYSSKPQPQQFTVLVHSIPVSVGSSVSDSVESFFTEYHPTTYLSHTVLRRTSKVQGLIKDANQLHKKILHLQSEPSEQRYKRVGLFGHKVDLLDNYGKRLEDLEQNVRLKQSEASLAEDTRAAFVSFKSRYGASTVFHLQQSINPTHWLTEEAPAPDDVYWPFFSSSFMRKWISKLVVVVACILLTILFLIPVVVVQGLTNLTQLEVWFPFLKSVLDIWPLVLSAKNGHWYFGILEYVLGNFPLVSIHECLNDKITKGGQDHEWQGFTLNIVNGRIQRTFVSQIVTGYLPSLILQLFLKAVAPIMVLLSSIQGYISHSMIEKSACSKVLWFTVWNIFFATVFSGSILNQFSIILDPKNIPSKLAVSVPAQASFFIAYVVTSGWTSTTSELARIFPLVCHVTTKWCSKSRDEEIEVPSIPYHKDIPRILFFALLVGIFTLKKLSLASTLVVPLPILTLLFNEYCRKRFLPIFIAYPAEVLIKKDKDDQNDAAMSGFLDKLVTAYQDPALMPVHYSADTDSLNRPLISSTEV
ncbi:hypothetical protein SADUNF_Sadunf10G0123700 [Salix dunnii]|uniref:CSC1-like protein n=1 Tax=Salix dunnii TaxID=1413687 RepID=A0A835JTR9_9ROSI|nr:hypothetical protein SADUNF_Sadunf10G0123700 [Salix dunnii]